MIESFRFAGAPPAITYPSASDKVHYVGFDNCDLAAGAFCTGTLSLDMAYGDIFALF